MTSLYRTYLRHEHEPANALACSGPRSSADSADCTVFKQLLGVYFLYYWQAMLRYCIDSLRPALRWRHNGHDGVSNHHFLLNHLFGRRSKKTSKLRVTGLCARNSPRTGEFPAQMASNAENVSISWRHHVVTHICVRSLDQKWLVTCSAPSYYVNQCW